MFKSQFVVCAHSTFHIVFIFYISVGYDIKYNTYHWLRKPYIHKDINLDNHEVNIQEYKFNYTSGEGKATYN